MPNHYFNFKQFTIWQNACAMKVTTDACLFGAWVAHKIQDKQVASILDIGTGTGLLSLMLAQNTTATIDAVEIEAAAAEQAKLNFDASLWSKRLHLFEQPIQQYLPNKFYDFIITNPPFFEDDLRSNNKKRNLALHSADLKFEELVLCIDRLLDKNGSFAILLPSSRVIPFTNLCLGLFFLQEKMVVKQTPKHDNFRNMLFFSRKKSIASEADTITIKNLENEYSEKFKQLLKPYYLYL